MHDNNVLKQALDNHKSVIGLYCFDDKIFDSNELGIRKLEVYRAKFLLESLCNLRKNLSDLLVPLEVSLKEPIAVIKLLAKKYDIKCVYTH
ncbi:deoxyribodipyrimidine photo-lyase [Aquimarina rhabdastrellae]